MNQPHFTQIPAALSRIPYVQLLGIHVTLESGELTGKLPFADHLIGNPLVPALHGGVIAALLYVTAAARLMLDTRAEALAQVFTATNEFLSNPHLQTTYAGAVLVTRTRRFANLRATAWQTDRTAPIAAASLQFLIA